jgi:hypothetical protein
MTSVPPGTPRAGASTIPPPNCTEPTREALAEPYNPTIIVAHRRTTPMSQARLLPSANTPTQNQFNAFIYDAAGRGDDTTDDNITVDEGLSPPLFDGNTQLDDLNPPDVDSVTLANGALPTGSGTTDDALPVAVALDDTTATDGAPDNMTAAATTIHDTDNTIDPAVRANFNAHDCAMSTVIAVAAATPQQSDTQSDGIPATASNLMAMLATTLAQKNVVLLGQICAEQAIYHITAKEEHNALLGHLNLTLTTTDHLEEEIQCMDTRINTLATTIANDITAAVTTDLKKYNRRVEGLASSVGHFSLEDGKIAKQVLDVQKGYNACLTVLESTIDAISKSQTALKESIASKETSSTPPSLPVANPPVLPPMVDTTPNNHSLNKTTGQQTRQPDPTSHWNREARPRPPPVNTTLPPWNERVSSPAGFHLPNTYLSTLVADTDDPGILKTTHTMWSNVQEATHQSSRDQTTANQTHSAPPTTPPLATRHATSALSHDPVRSPATSVTPLKGVLITSPCNMDREQHACQMNASCFDISTLTHARYHGNRDGHEQITDAFLQSCGYTNFTSDDIITCFNNIISAHKRVYHLWFNMANNTAAPQQVDCILQKSLKLFPSLNSNSTNEVGNFYDQLQEVSSSHLIAIMPFTAIMLRNHFKGLWIPGLSVMRYATMGKALMELLPHLIPGQLSPQINAALASVRYETNSGYDYLWRVLELTVPGFNPVIPIQVPVWSNIADIFKFLQAYLLYFRLQGKMNFHYMAAPAVVFFLRAIQYTEFADMVTTLQSHVNSYREPLDNDYLPPHLCLHGLANSIHQNTQAPMRDIVPPRLRRLNCLHDLIQGPPCINCVGRDERPRAQFWDGHKIFGNRPCGGTPREKRKRTPRDNFGNGYDRARTPARNQGRVVRSDRNRHPFLPNVPCVACKHVGHVAKHWDMLATAICLERYMKHDLLASVRDSIERDWLEHWKHGLGNPDSTLCQVLQAYVKELDITVA